MFWLPNFFARRSKWKRQKFKVSALKFRCLRCIILYRNKWKARALIYSCVNSFNKQHCMPNKLFMYLGNILRKTKTYQMKIRNLTMKYFLLLTRVNFDINYSFSWRALFNFELKVNFVCCVLFRFFVEQKKKLF